MTSPAPDRMLVRGIPQGDLVALAINAVIGAGIFGVPAVLYARVGQMSIVAILIAALIVFMITLCFAEVGSAFEETGGPYLYALHTFGPALGFQIGWLLWVARLFGFAAVVNLFLNYSTFLLPALEHGVARSLAAVLIVLLLTIINLLGIRGAARVSTILTIGKLIPLALFVIVGAFYVEGSRILPLNGVPPLTLWSAVLLAIYAFSGFEILAIPGGEIKNPGRAIPFALLSALGVVAVVYIGVQVVAVGTLADPGSSARPLADAAMTHLGRPGATIMVIGAIISTLGVAHTIVLAAARLPFAMAERGQLPALFARVHPRFRTPWVGIVLSNVCMLTFTLASTFTSAATFTVEIRILTYLVTCAALPVLRRRAREGSTGFRVPAGDIVAMGSVVICIALILSRPVGELKQLAVAIGLGAVGYLVLAKRPAVPGTAS
jgi:basic amino acid/polyamine antiporter, APA family